MNEADLCKIRDALAQPTLAEAIRAMQKTLLELGYYLAVPNNNIKQPL